MNKDFLTRFGLAQAELKAPKNQYNSFGQYSYRSCEDILEAAKPVCAKYGLLLTVSDEIVHEGDRYYIKATAALYDAQGGSDEVMSATAYAREPETKKGMDDSQITGTASSYARKYALNGLFCIDDTRDSDTTDNTSSNGRRTASKSAKEPAEPEYKCAECGAPFKEFTSGSQHWTAKQVYEISLNKCGGKRALCKNCREK
ncbi:MAG: ERF family protein, partial [Oscillospiraceae bacterium]